LDRFETFKKE
jgi:hypothetical protein